MWCFLQGRWLAWPLAETARHSLQDVEALKQQLQAAATPRAPLHASGSTNKRVPSAQPGKGSKQAPTHTCGKVRGWSRPCCCCVHFAAWKAHECWTSGRPVYAEVRPVSSICKRFETSCSSASPATSAYTATAEDEPKRVPCLAEGGSRHATGRGQHWGPVKVCSLQSSPAAKQEKQAQQQGSRSLVTQSAA